MKLVTVDHYQHSTGYVESLQLGLRRLLSRRSSQHHLTNLIVGSVIGAIFEDVVFATMLLTMSIDARPDRSRGLIVVQVRDTLVFIRRDQAGAWVMSRHYIYTCDCEQLGVAALETGAVGEGTASTGPFELLRSPTSRLWPYDENRRAHVWVTNRGFIL